MYAWAGEKSFKMKAPKRPVDFWPSVHHTDGSSMYVASKDGELFEDSLASAESALCDCGVHKSVPWAGRRYDPRP
jgi:hypothetical protein